MAKLKTLQDAIVYFSDFESCQRYAIDIRFPDGKVHCLSCGSERVTYLQKQRRCKCYENHPKPQFSLKVGTIMEDSAIGLDKWLCAIWLIASCKNGVFLIRVEAGFGRHAKDRAVH